MYNIELVEQESQPVLILKKKTSLKMLPQIIGEGYMKIFGYLNKLNENPSGAPYTAYYTWQGEEMDIELGFPVSKIFPDFDDIKSREIPKGKYAELMHKGSYSKMEEPYNELFKWLNENNLEPDGPFYEFYYNSPQEVSEEELLTKISVPVKEK